MENQPQNQVNILINQLSYLIEQMQQKDVLVNHLSNENKDLKEEIKILRQGIAETEDSTKEKRKEESSS